MKKFVFFIASILIAIIINAQSGCDVIITSNFESQCVLTLEKGDPLKELDGLILACKDSEVEYYATSTDVITYNWTVTGANSYIIINNGAGVRVNWSNGNIGEVKVQVITQDGSACESIKHIVLIEKPQIQSSSIPNYRFENGIKVIEVCLGESVTFTNESITSNTDIVGHYWESIYGSASTENYTIENIMQETKVIHKIINNCGCEDEERYEIRILEGKKLELSCYGTVCEGSEVTYEAMNVNCNQYNWFVEGGIIKSGQNSSKITIEWGNPQCGYGILGLDGSQCEGLCPKPMSVKIPIITNNAEISGQTTVCTDEAVVYSLPLWGSTEYSWTITPQQGVYQSQFENSNETLIQFTLAGTYYLNAVYKCDFLECGPFSTQTKTIIVKDKLKIESDRKNICKGQSASFTLSNVTVNALWKVYDENNQQIYSTQSNNLVYAPTQAGKYKITAEDVNYCNIAEFNIKVKDPPPPPSGNTISGKQYVCPGASVLLSGIPESPFYGLVWKSLCSNPETGGTGNEFTVNYLGNTCNVEIYHFDKEVECLSTTPYIFQIQDFNLAPTTLPTSGITICTGTTLIEYINDEVPNQSPEVIYEWKISPEYAATIIGDKTLNNISILVNNTNLTSFDIILKRTYCTDLVNTITIPVTIVSPPPAPTISPSPIPSVCAGTSITLTGFGAITNNDSDFSWSIDNGAREYNGLRSITHTFTTSGNHNIELSYHPYSICPATTTNDIVNIKASPSFRLHDNNDNSVSVSPRDGGGYTNYSWTVNGITQSNNTGTLTGVHINDVVCCTVTNANGCSTEECITLHETPGGNHPPCSYFNATYTNTTICTDQSIYVSTTDNPTQNSVAWTISPYNLHTIEYINNNEAKITFTEPGTYSVTGYTTDGQNCYKSNTMNIFVPNILDFEVEYDCPVGGIKITDKSKYFISIPNRIFTISGGIPSINMSPTERVKTQTVALPTTPTTYNITLSIGGCTLSKSVTLYPQITSAQITTSHQSNYACQDVPLLLTANVSPALTSIKSCLWNFGDNSGNTSTTNTIYHTFPMQIGSNPPFDYYPYVTVTDKNNCSVTSPTIHIELNGNDLYPNRLRFPLSDVGDVCPGVQRQILYDPNISTPALSTYLWHLTPPTNNSNDYFTYKTDDYYVRVTSSLGCIGEAMINVPFKNKPTAFISCNNTYCLNDKIELFGATGSNSETYLWNVIDPNFGYQQFSTPNISFTATKAGTYSIYLTVDNGECSDTYTKTIDVHPSSVAPSIYFAGNQCIDQPPVVLGANSPNGERIYWNTGVSNSTADYYSPGVALAYYYDINGCKSEEAKIIIPSAPNYDALLTGCYKRCKSLLPPYLNVYGISKDKINWKWILDQTIIANGIGEYLFSPLTLPLNGFGTYNLDVHYSNNCNTVSPSLVIEEEDCPCEKMDAKVTSIKHIEECRIIYNVEVDICNNGNYEACLKDLFAATEGIEILQIDNLPLNIPVGYCEKIKFSFEVHDPLTDNASFRIYDECNKCYIDFSVGINIEIIDCAEDIILESIDFSTEFSSQTMSYFKFIINLPSSPQAIFRVWSEPSQVLNYHFNQGSNIDGLVMFDRNLLEQMANNNEQVCFHVIMCKDNIITECFVCMDASKLLVLIQNAGYKSTQRKSNDDIQQETQKDRKLYLVPNPASTFVKVEGVEQKDISEILLIDIQGKNIQKVQNTNTMNIQNILKGTYIIRVICNDSEVYYLKMIKN